MCLLLVCATDAQHSPWESLEPDDAPGDPITPLRPSGDAPVPCAAACIAAARPGYWELQFGSHPAKKIQRPLFTLCTNHLTSPHLPGVGQCSNRSCNRCERLLCARRERVTEGALSRASHSALSHHTPQATSSSRFQFTPIFSRTVQKGGLMIILSVFVRVDCVISTS